ncbi:MAG TPA: hypothetical protein VF772_02205, partial [Terriglobales bacterium]
QSRERSGSILSTIARYFVAIPVLFFSLEQLLHGDHVPGIPLKALTPTWIFGMPFGLTWRLRFTLSREYSC